MNVSQQSHGLTHQVGYAGFSRVAEMVASSLVSWRSARKHDQARQAQCDTATLLHAEQLFVRALCDDSNLEMDWLWLATQVVREHERRYCLERALRINPQSEMAQRELTKLSPVPVHMQHLAGHI